MRIANYLITCSRMARTGLLAAALLILSGVGGCAANTAATQPSEDAGERALKDPFHYGVDQENPDISGGGILDYHHKAMQRDVDDVFNP